MNNDRTGATTEQEIVQQIVYKLVLYRSCAVERQKNGFTGTVRG